MTSSVRVLLAAVFAALGVVLINPAPASACSCVSGDARQFVKWADVVFTGTVTDHAPPPAQATMSSTDPATYTFEVERVFKGDVAATTEIRSASSGASCGLENIDVGGSYLVFAGLGRARGDTERLWANLCGGTQRSQPGIIAEVEAVAGPGRAPDRSAADPVPLPGDDGDVSDGSTSTTLAVVGGGVLLLVAIAVAVRLRRP